MVWIFQKKCNEDIPRFSPQTGLQQPILLIYTYSLREKGDPKSSIMSKKKKKNIKKKKKEGREREIKREREKKRDMFIAVLITLLGHPLYFSALYSCMLQQGR